MNRRTIVSIGALATGAILVSGAYAPMPRAEALHDDWRIEPRRGIGRLTFGLLPAEVEAFGAIYGAPGRIAQSHSAADLETVIATQHLESALSAAEIAMLRRLAVEADLYSTQVLQGAGPTVLDYREGRLASVMVEPRSGPVAFLDKPVFELSARDTLLLFETANEGPGRYRSTEAAFDQLAISLDGFSAAGAGGVRLLSAKDYDFKQRSITLRAEPYRPENEIAQFVTHSVR